MVKEISAEELEAACRKCMRLEVTDAKALARLLDGMNAVNILSETPRRMCLQINVTKLGPGP